MLGKLKTDLKLGATLLNCKLGIFFFFFAKIASVNFTFHFISNILRPIK